ncbi:MAG TPA: YtxH domain-containing protein [Gemmatimonadota bacterium]|nr:YtxH domain-containing protein [Gemmatimonadota bacterium]
MSDSNNGFLGGVLLGIILGAVLAILYAPEKGEKMRKRLVKKSGQLQEKASDALGTAGDLMGKGRKKMGI